MFVNSAYFGFYLKKFREKEKIILYGKEQLVKNLKRYTEINGFMITECYFCDDPNDNSYINIMYEEPSKYFVWIVSEEYIDLCHKLDEIGLVQHQDYATIFRPPYMNLYERFPLDTHLGYTSYTGGEYPGVVVFGNENAFKDPIKIVTLGGSTSDSQAYSWKSWSEILYDRLIELGIDNVIVYSAGVCGYTSAQELIKLQRDMISINPNIVISLSGVNDHYDKKNAWFTDYQQNMMSQLALKGFTDITNGRNYGYSNGFDEKISSSQMWIKNIRMMHALCEEYGVNFFAFLQPMIGAPGMELKGEAKEFVDNNFNNRMYFSKRFIMDIKSIIDDYSYIYDISDILVGHEEVFFDDAHVTEKGNAIIANAIWEIVSKNIYLAKNKVLLR